MNDNNDLKKQYNAVMNSAVKLLSQRNHTAYEIFQKLKKRSFNIDLIQSVIAECKRLNYINDDETAKIYFNELKHKGYGSKRIWLQMKKKGLDNEKIESCFAKYNNYNDEKDNALKVLEKNITRFKREKDMKKRKEKIYRFLSYRGFSGSIISEVLKETDKCQGQI